MILQSIIESILDNAKIEDLFEDENITLKKQGSVLKCCCPFHEEKTPSCVVNVATNRYHCFGCGASGNVVGFLMNHLQYTYPDAIKHLGKKYNIEIEEEKETVEEQQERLNREALYLLNERARDFYADLLQKTPKAKAYMDARFGEKFVIENKYGYAPGKSTLLHWAQDNKESIDNLIKVSLLSRDEDDGHIYDFFSDRVLFPICDRSGRTIGFSGRTLKTDGSAKKYINSRDTEIYHKSKTVFCLPSAIKIARKKGFFFCVEGGPDAARMQSVGIYNAVAPMGGEWSDEQFAILKRYVPKIVFINDADDINEKTGNLKGIDIVIKNAKKAMESGLIVGVRELLPLESGEKTDPGEFFSSPDDLQDTEHLLEEENFVEWYAGRLFKGKVNSTQKSEAIKEIAWLLALVKDDTEQTIILDAVNSRYVKNKHLLQDKVTEALYERKRKSSKDNKVDLLTYGFCESKGGYMAADGKVWTNFTMKPLYHIRDDESSKRLFTVQNDKNERETVELTSEELNSSTKFSERMLDVGDFRWEADGNALVKLRRYLVGSIKSARRIKQMGWNPGAGYVFGNGIWTDSFIAANDEGIVDLGDGGCWYIPAASKRLTDDSEKYEREQRFVYNQLSQVTLEEYLQKFCVVYGGNGKVGIAFWLMSLFRDIVVQKTRKFPLLNLYGPSGTGKTEMGQALMAFFGTGNKAPNIRNSTFPALNADISMYSNALWHADEYKNDLHPAMIEFLKGLYDGVGRTKLKGANFDERTMTKVKCGVILSGQEMPTADIALFNRCIFLEFMNSKFTHQQTMNYNELFDINRRGLMYLTTDVIRHRQYFEVHFEEYYNEVMDTIRRDESAMWVDTRVIENWSRLAATIKCLQSRIRLPFTFEEYMELTFQYMLKQSRYCSEKDELANFWQSFAYMLDSGQIANECDFRVCMEFSIKTEEYSLRQFSQRKRILYLNKNSVFGAYQKAIRTMGIKQIEMNSLVSYLENCPQFLGHKKSMRFKWIVNGQNKMEINSKGKMEQVYNVRRAMAFDYDSLVEQYGLQLESNAQSDLKPEEPDVPEEPEPGKESEEGEIFPF